MGLVDMVRPFTSLDEAVEDGTRVTSGVATGRRWTCADTPAFAISFAAFVAPALYTGSMYALHVAISTYVRMNLVLRALERGEAYTTAVVLGSNQGSTQPPIAAAGSKPPTRQRALWSLCRRAHGSSYGWLGCERSVRSGNQIALAGSSSGGERAGLQKIPEP